MHRSDCPDNQSACSDHEVVRNSHILLLRKEQQYFIIDKCMAVAQVQLPTAAAKQDTSQNKRKGIEAEKRKKIAATASA